MRTAVSPCCEVAPKTRADAWRRDGACSALAERGARELLEAVAPASSGTVAASGSGAVVRRRAIAALGRAGAAAAPSAASTAMAARIAPPRSRQPRRPARGRRRSGSARPPATSPHVARRASVPCIASMAAAIHMPMIAPYNMAKAGVEALGGLAADGARG